MPHGVLTLSLLWTVSSATAVADFWQVGVALLFGGVCALTGFWLSARKVRRAARSAAWFRTAVERGPDAVFFLDRRGCVLFANPQASAIVGRPVTELLGRDTSEVFGARFGELLRAPERSAVGEGAHWEEIEFPAAARKWDVRLVPCPSAEGVLGTVCIVRDVTERNRAQDSVERNTAYLRAVLDSLADGVVVADAEGNLLDWNPAALRMHGYRHVEAVRRPAVAFSDSITLSPVGGEPLRFAEWPISRLLRGQEVTACELVMRRTDNGLERVLQFSGATVRRPDGATDLVVVTIHDVTDRRRAEDELRASERRFRAFADHAADAFFLHDEGGRVIDTNRQALDSLQLSRSELVGQTPLAFDPDATTLQLETILARLNVEATLAFESRHRRKDGSVFPVELRIRSFDAGGRRLAVALARDITDRVKAQESLRASEESYRLLFESNPLPMWVFHTDTLAFLAVNRAAVAKYGYSPDEFLGMTIRDIRPQEDVARLEGEVLAVSGRLSDSGLWRHRLKDGKIIQVRVFSHPLAFHGQSARLVMAQDVTAQLVAEQAFRESEERLRTALEASATGLWDWNLSSGGIAWQPDRPPVLSDASEAFDGTATDLDRILHPDDRERVWAAARHAIATRSLFECEFRTVHPGGGGRWVASRGRAVYAPDGRPERMVGTVTDVTARKTAELELRRTRAVLQNLVDHSPALIFMTDVEGRYLLFNPRCAAATGVRTADVLGKTVSEAFPPDIARRFEQRDRDTLAAGVPQVSEEELRTPDGPVYLSTVRFPVTDSDGRVIALGGVSTDITGRKRAEDELRASEELFRLLADESPHMVWLCDPDGRPEYVNGRWCEYTGQAAAQVAGLGWVEAVHPDDRDGFLQAWRDTIAQGAARAVQVRFRRADGAYRWFLTQAKPVSGGSGRAPRWYGVSADIEEQRQREDSLLRADIQKDAFLATLAHELRNPLAPLADAVRLLGEVAPTPARLKELRELVAGQVQSLTRLVDDLSDLSRVRRGTLDLRHDVVGLGAVLRVATQTSDAHIRAARHRLTVSLDPDPVFVTGDAVRLAQVVSNLLTNAAKYTPQGGNIWLSLSRDGASAVVRVRDDGAGIAPDVLPRVFDMFVQEGRLQKQAPGGLGIGLALVRQIVKLHGGTIEAHSAGPGTGAEFVVRLPLAAPGTSAAPEPVPAGSPCRRVLVVDDNEGVAKSFSWVLSAEGHEVAVAHDGPSAVEQVRAFRPDVVVLDLGLPGASGCEVARAVRALPEGQGLTLVAVTGWGGEADRLQTRAAGFDYHLTKPVDYRALTEILAAVAPRG